MKQITYIYIYIHIYIYIYIYKDVGATKCEYGGPFYLALNSEVFVATGDLPDSVPTGDSPMLTTFDDWGFYPTFNDWGFTYFLDSLPNLFYG